MKSVDGSLVNIWHDGKAACFQFSLSVEIHIKPGQFLMVRSGMDVIPFPVYPAGITPGTLTSMNSAGSEWQVGENLAVSGAHGMGFDIPAQARRLLMVSTTGSPIRLLPSAIEMLERGGEAALLASVTPTQIPAEVELLDEDQLNDALTWADCIIGDARLRNLTSGKNLFSRTGNGFSGLAVQVLVDTPLVCSGKSQCGVCAVKTRHGWKQACTDGPVFNLSDLEMA
jgi:NAD(P)H-flavin reductase